MLSGIAMFFVKATTRPSLFTGNVDFSTIVKAIISFPTLSHDVSRYLSIVFFFFFKSKLHATSWQSPQSMYCEYILACLWAGQTR